MTEVIVFQWVYLSIWSKIFSMENKDGKFILGLSVPLALLVILASLAGLLIPGFYSAQTPNWQAQSVGQDMADLFLLVPALLITAFLASRQNRKAFLIWGGVVLYLTYTFAIYCFDVYFNRLFLAYCLAFGLSVYSFLYFLFQMTTGPVAFEMKKKLPVKVTGIYFLVIAVLFYFLWLSELLPSILRNESPAILAEIGLPTNPVHVLDLSLVLPAIFISGILLLKNKAAGVFLAPVILTFFIFMDLTIGGLILVMRERGLEGEITLTIAMAVLALFSLVLLVWFISNIRKT